MVLVNFTCSFLFFCKEKQFNLVLDVYFKLWKTQARVLTASQKYQGKSIFWISNKSSQTPPLILLKTQTHHTAPAAYSTPPTHQLLILECLRTQIACRLQKYTTKITIFLRSRDLKKVIERYRMCKFMHEVTK